MPDGKGLTTQAQRPGARDAMMATATLPPGSLQRMVRRRGHLLSSIFLKNSLSNAFRRAVLSSNP